MLALLQCLSNKYVSEFLKQRCSVGLDSYKVLACTFTSLKLCSKLCFADREMVPERCSVLGYRQVVRERGPMLDEEQSWILAIIFFIPVLLPFFVIWEHLCLSKPLILYPGSSAVPILYCRTMGINWWGSRDLLPMILRAWIGSHSGLTWPLLPW